MEHKSEECVWLSCLNSTCWRKPDKLSLAGWMQYIPVVKEAMKKKKKAYVSPGYSIYTRILTLISDSWLFTDLFVCFVKKQKQRSFLFLFDVSKYKKKVKILTPIISRDHAKQFSVYKDCFSPSVLLLYTMVWPTENWMACTSLENVMFTKNMCRTVSTLCATQFTVTTSVFYLGSTQNWKF